MQWISAQEGEIQWKVKSIKNKNPILALACIKIKLQIALMQLQIDSYLHFINN